MNKFTPQYEPTIRMSYIFDVARQMLSGWVGSGDRTLEFERMIQDITKSKYVISTTSGTMALYLGLSALGIDKSKTIVFPAYTFLAAANVCRQLGYNVELVDVKLDTMCIDPDKLKLNSSHGAVIFVNHNGYVGPDVQRVKAICDEAKIPMIEDSSQALGMPTAGTTGVFGVFSFSVPKLITTGQGGVIFTDDSELAVKIRQIHDQGDNWRKDKIHKNIGINLKFNDILSAYGIAQLKRLKKLLKIRKNIFKLYKKHLNLYSQNIVNFGYDSTWMVIYKTDRADQIITELRKKDIQAVKYYRPVNENPPYTDGKVYENSVTIYNKYLYLPSSLNLKSSKIKEICQIIMKTEKEI